MSSGADLDVAKRELLVLAQRQSARINYSTDECPCRWRPNTVRHPHGPHSFTTRMAWEFIVELLEAGHPIEPVELRKPQGKTAYVLLVDIGGPYRLYIKLQLRSGRIIGRSFHYSAPGGNDE